MKNSYRACQYAFFLIILYATGAVAQSPDKGRWIAGISAGYTNNELYTNITNYDYSSYQKERGFAAFIPVQYTIKNWLAVQTEPGFMQKSFSLHHTSQTDRPTNLTSRYNYIQLPVMAHGSITVGKWKGFVNIGIYGAYWLSGTLKGNQLDIYNQYPITLEFLFHTQEVNGKYAFDSRRDRRLQFGWLAGAGFQYSINKKFDFFVEGRYSEDITDQQKNYMHNQVPRYNRTTSVSAGCLFHFSFN